MSLYTGTIILTELLMLAMALHVLTYKSFKRRQKFWFLITYSTVMLCAGMEWLAVHYNEHGPSFVVPLTIGTVIQFSFTPLLPVYFAGALGIERLARRASAVFVLHIAVEIMAAPFGWIFYYDDHGKYFHGPYYLLYEAIYLFSLVFLVISLISAGRHFQKRDLWTIIMVFVVTVAAILPLLLYHIYTNYIGIAISACLCYIYYNDLVQQDVRADLETNQDKIGRMQEHIISELANLIENRDLETGEHVARTSEYVKGIAEAARQDGVYADVIDDGYIAKLYELTPLHDIGKIVVPDRILRKEGPLTEEEFALMKQHAAAGGRIVREILEGITDEENIRFAQDIALYHHEHWDGTGYPQGLAGEEIPLCARIMAIADVYDALVSERYYKKAMPAEEALEIIRRESGTHFEPALTEVFLRHRDRFGAGGEE